ncbi:MAG TPA: AAA family ATPase, partial [Gemmatimonadaceae bacterium]|nr:AAA family ATPase [Gemmatimonadaceae bacterium]
MRGLTIIGAGSEAGELAVARTACEVLREGGSSPSLYEPGLDETTDAGALLDGARAAASGDVLVTVLGGGLLAPVTPRLSVRDLAASLGAPVVIALSGGPDAVNVARLSVESARAARLAVKAVVVPEGESGAQLDGLVDVPVETLPANPTA